MEHSGDHDTGHREHASHHEMMAADFRWRFWASLALTVPVLILAPLVQDLVGLREALQFPGDSYAQWGLATLIFVYGGKPGQHRCTAGFNDMSAEHDQYRFFQPSGSHNGPGNGLEFIRFQNRGQAVQKR